MKQIKEHEFFMKRAFDLAKLGMGRVSPNPLVGCVIVQEGQIIGEGYHQAYGKPHAEVNAVNSVKDRSKLKGAEVYVSLEPCSHFGKTPPCADLLVKEQVGKVYISNADPNPLVAGKGILKLESAGIKVQTGVLEAEGWELNKRFFTFLIQKRPYIILKWAETADGFVARENYDSKWISNWLSRKHVHKWRAEEDAIMVGTNTALYDDPSLTVREWQGKHPLRLVIDNQLKLSKNLKLFSDTEPTVCYNHSLNESSGNVEYVRLETKNYLENILTDLYERKVQSLFIEGGGGLLTSLIQYGLWDEMRIFRSGQRFDTGISAPKSKGNLKSEEHILGDKLEIFRNIN